MRGRAATAENVEIDPNRTLDIERGRANSHDESFIQQPSHDCESDDRNAAQCRLARLIASDRAPTKTRLNAQVASRLNQLCDTNLRPR